MRFALWMTCCALAGCVALLFSMMLVMLMVLGICLHGADESVLLPAIAASPFVGAILGCYLGNRHARARDGRPTAGAWCIVVVVGLVPLALIAWAGTH
jgi:hypothetical protein